VRRDSGDRDREAAWVEGETELVRLAKAARALENERARVRVEEAEPGLELEELTSARPTLGCRRTTGAKSRC